MMTSHTRNLKRDPARQRNYDLLTSCQGNFTILQVVYRKRRDVEKEKGLGFFSIGLPGISPINRVLLLRMKKGSFIPDK